MAFFDKLNNIARNIGDKTSDAIETTKLNSKISSERAAAGEELKKIGEYYYNLFAAGGEVPPEILEVYQSAKMHLDAASAAQAEVERIRTENATAAPAASAPAAGMAACPGCGGMNPAGTRFCASCGNKLEAEPVMQPQGVFCPGCGTSLPADTKFCNSCGQRLDG